MKNVLALVVILASIAEYPVCGKNGNPELQTSPNIIFILADDLVSRAEVLEFGLFV